MARIISSIKNKSRNSTVMALSPIDRFIVNEAFKIKSQTSQNMDLKNLVRMILHKSEDHEAASTQTRFLNISNDGIKTMEVSGETVDIIEFDRMRSIVSFSESNMLLIRYYESYKPKIIRCIIFSFSRSDKTDTVIREMKRKMVLAFGEDFQQNIYGRFAAMSSKEMLGQGTPE